MQPIWLDRLYNDVQPVPAHHSSEWKVVVVIVVLVLIAAMVSAYLIKRSKGNAGSDLDASR